MSHSFSLLLLLSCQCLKRKRSFFHHLICVVVNTSMTKNFWLFFFEQEPNKDRYSTFLHSATLLLCWARMWFLNAFNLCLQFQKKIVSLKYYEILCIVVDGSNSSTTIQSLKKEVILRKQRNRGCSMRNFLLASCFNR